MPLQSPGGGCRWRLERLALVGVGFAVAIPIVARRYLPGEEWLGLLGLTPLAGGVACIGLAAIRNYKAAAITFAASAVAFSTMLFAIGAQRADEHQTSHVLLRAAFESTRRSTARFIQNSRTELGVLRGSANRRVAAWQF